MHRSGGASAWFAAAVAALLLGVVAMFALGLHGAPGVGATSHVGLLAASAHDGGSVPSVAPVGTPTVAPTSHGDSQGHGGPHAMAGLCLAILAAGLLALGAALVRRQQRPWITFGRSTSPPLLAVARARGVGAGPPDVWAFSVIRC